MLGSSRFAQSQISSSVGRWACGRLEAARPSARRLDRARGADFAFVAALLVAGAALVVIGRGLTFSTLGDEWTFIQTRSLSDLATWFPPHNEHWSTAFVIVFRAMFETIGFRSYIPYLLVLVALHGVVVTGVYVLARTQTTSWVALTLIVPFMLFGSGWENLLLFFQASILMALAGGLWALAALRSASDRQALVAAVLLVIGAMSASTGVVFVVVGAVELIVARRLKHLAVILPRRSPTCIGTR